SWEELQERITSIVDALNADRSLAIAAAANPFAALEELGYQVDAEARPEIADRLRFPPREAARPKQLRARIFEEVGHGFGLDAGEELRGVLYEELSIRPYPDEHGCYPEPPDTHPPGKPASGAPAPDPLAVLAGRHPVMEPLLEYRSLDALHAPFASRAAYEAIRTGAVPTGIRKLRVRLKGGGQGETPAAGETPPPRPPGGAPPPKAAGG